MDISSTNISPITVGTPSNSPETVNDKERKDSKPTDTILATTQTIDTLTLNGQDEPTSEKVDLAAARLANASTLRKLALLSMFSLAEFLDAFNNSALFPAIPGISTELSFLPSETIWIISAYQLTFAAFLLVSGRISDVFTPKPAFIAGCLILGLTHLGGGFTRQKIALIVLRALGGIGGALTIPSALSMIVQTFPNPSSQARAIALFGSSGAIGNIIGILIGAALVKPGWEWIFWFVAIVGVGIATACLFLIPNSNRQKGKNVKFDVTGVTTLSTSVILFIFAVTSGSTEGWGTAYVLAPLIISIALAGAFFWWESRLHPDDAVLPPRMWRYRNFGILVALALVPYLWWVTSFVLLTAWWQEVFGWSAIKTAVHFLPMGVSAWLISFITGRLPHWFAHKYILLAGLLLSVIATILLPFGDSPAKYWRYDFPAFIIGSIGMMIIFANSSIAIFSYTPPHVAGTVGAVFNSALQLGSAVGLAAISSISNSVNSKQTFDPPSNQWSPILNEIPASTWRAAFKGQAAAYWFLLAVLGTLLVSVTVFFKVDLPVHDNDRILKESNDVEARPPEKKPVVEY